MIGKKMSEFVNKKDKQILKTSALVIADQIVASIPLLNVAWGLSKALYGAGMQVRQQKALEWIEMIRDNPNIFTKKLFETEEFQDSFVLALENFIKERNHDKRIILKEIFKDYSSSNAPSEYPLERFNNITEQISIFDAKNFSYIVSLSKQYKSWQSFRDTRESLPHIESVLHLVSLGLLIQDNIPRLAKENQGLEQPYIYVSGLGAEYIKFVKDLR